MLALAFFYTLTTIRYTYNHSLQLTSSSLTRQSVQASAQ